MPAVTRSGVRVAFAVLAAICRNEGVGMIPLPADFLSARLPCNPMYAVPQARGFQNVQKALWEYLGSLAGG